MNPETPSSESNDSASPAGDAQPAGDIIKPASSDAVKPASGGTEPTSDAEKVQQIDTLLSHVWMVRTFLKHSEEAEEDDELREVHRTLYDYMLALGAPLKEGDHAKYLKQAKKKLKKLKNATELFEEIQPEISSHTNFQMAAHSLKVAVAQVAALVEKKPA